MFRVALILAAVAAMSNADLRDHRCVSKSRWGVEIGRKELVDHPKHPGKGTCLIRECTLNRKQLKGCDNSKNTSDKNCWYAEMSSTGEYAECCIYKGAPVEVGRDFEQRVGDTSCIQIVKCVIEKGKQPSMNVEATTC